MSATTSANVIARLKLRIKKAVADGNAAKAKALRRQLKQEQAARKAVASATRKVGGSATQKQSGSGKSTHSILRDRGHDIDKDVEKSGG